jgi:hypothetical protein
MAFGKEVASFSTKSTSMTKGTDAAGNHTFDMNMEGTVSGAWSGTLLLTMIGSTADFQSGTYTADSAAYLDDGSVVTATGGGVFGATSGHKWQVNGTGVLADGSRFAAEAVLDLASRSYNGKIFEIT